MTMGCPSTGCKGYELTKDLDFTTSTSYRAAVVNEDWTVVSFTNNSDFGWDPIGNFINDECSDCFRGIFNGNGHTISNLQINRNNIDHIGLFASMLANAIVNNIGLSEVEIVGKDYVGSLVGRNQADATIINSYAIGKVSGTVRVGGLSGLNNGKIINSYANVGVTGAGVIVGGLVGDHDGASGEIENSYAMGPVSSSGETPMGLGGLIGRNSATVYK